MCSLDNAKALAQQGRLRHATLGRNIISRKMEMPTGTSHSLSEGGFSGSPGKEGKSSISFDRIDKNGGK
jgi:hypothetical protein